MIPQKRQDDIRGYIVESGSNDLGSWIKFSDGTMICTGRPEVESGLDRKDITLPNSFMDTYYNVVVTNIYRNSPSIFWSGGANTINSIALFPRLRDGQVINFLTQCQYIAIGRWK